MSGVALCGTGDHAQTQFRHPHVPAPRADIECLLVHPGGPFWAKKDWGAWSIPKGEYAEGEDPLTVARREFEEETGARAEGDFLPLGESGPTGPQDRHRLGGRRRLRPCDVEVE